MKENIFKNNKWELFYWGVVAILSNSTFIKISWSIMAILVTMVNNGGLSRRMVEITRIVLLTYALGSFPLLPVFYPRIRFDINSILLSYSLILAIFSLSNKTLKDTLEYM